MTLSGFGDVTTVKREDPLPKAKPFEIPKRIVWEAWKRVAANKYSATIILSGPASINVAG